MIIQIHTPMETRGTHSISYLPSLSPPFLSYLTTLPLAYVFSFQISPVQNNGGGNQGSLERSILNLSSILCSANTTVAMFIFAVSFHESDRGEERETER